MTKLPPKAVQIFSPHPRPVSSYSRRHCPGLVVVEHGTVLKRRRLRKRLPFLSCYTGLEMQQRLRFHGPLHAAIQAVAITVKEKLASGLYNSLSETKVRQTQTLRTELWWGNDTMHARYYSSWQSRFLSVDPGPGNPRQPQSWNRYAYVLGNPVKYVDPDGLATWDPGRGGWIDEITVTGEIDYIASWEEYRDHGCSLPLTIDQRLDQQPNIGDMVDVMTIVGENAPVVEAYEGLAEFYTSFFAFGGAEAVEGLLSLSARFFARSSGRAVARGVVRATSRGLTEQLALAEAKGGAGTRIMKGMIKDPKFPEAVWAKMQHVHRCPGGERIVIHYWEDLQTGVRQGFKFK